MNRALRIALVALAVAPFAAVACSSSKDEPKPLQGQPVSAIPGHETLQDNSHKEGPRLVPSEVYLRTYLSMFGDSLTPLQVEEIARGDLDGSLFDRWSDYLGSLGFPDYKVDVTRARNTNALMLASFERLGIALCVRAAERELGANPPPLAERRVFAFDLTPGEPTEAEFADRFDVLHRTFLSYPASLAETNRTKRFYDLYKTVYASHAKPDAYPSLITPVQAGWAAVCYGLTRHPEFHIY